MAENPTVGGSDGTWGTELNAVLDELRTKTAGDIPTINDSESNEMLKFHAYKVQTSGFVTARASSTANILVGWVGDTNDPAGAGIRVIHSKVAADSPSIAFFVPNGKYFEITITTATPTIVWTPLVSGGAAPVDQD